MEEPRKLEEDELPKTPAPRPRKVRKTPDQSANKKTEYQEKESEDIPVSKKAKTAESPNEAPAPTRILRERRRSSNSAGPGFMSDAELTKLEKKSEQTEKRRAAFYNFNSYYGEVLDVLPRQHMATQEFDAFPRFRRDSGLTKEYIIFRNSLLDVYAELSPEYMTFEDWLNRASETTSDPPSQSQLPFIKRLWKFLHINNHINKGYKRQEEFESQSPDDSEDDILPSSSSKSRKPATDDDSKASKNGSKSDRRDLAGSAQKTKPKRPIGDKEDDKSEVFAEASSHTPLPAPTPTTIDYEPPIPVDSSPFVSPAQKRRLTSEKRRERKLQEEGNGISSEGHILPDSEYASLSTNRPTRTTSRTSQLKLSQNDMDDDEGYNPVGSRRASPRTIQTRDSRSSHSHSSRSRSEKDQTPTHDTPTSNGASSSNAPTPSPFPPTASLDPSVSQSSNYMNTDTISSKPDAATPSQPAGPPVKVAYDSYAYIPSLLKPSPKDASSFKVYVIGAGIAGLAAAQYLRQHGISNIVVLESRVRIGGRILSAYLNGNLFELGASVLHGEVGNPIVELSNHMDIGHHVISPKSTQVDPTKDSSSMIPDEASDPSPKQQVNSSLKTQYTDLFESPLIGHEEEMESVDYSVSEQTMAEMARKAYEESRSLHEHSWHTLIRYGTSVKNVDPVEEIYMHEFDGSRVQLDAGLGDIIANLSIGIDIRLGCQAIGIDADPLVRKDSVLVQFLDPLERVQCDSASAVIVTAPLAILKEGIIEFYPNLPEKKLEAIKKLGVGYVNKIVMVFPARFWPTSQDAISIVTQDFDNGMIILSNNSKLMEAMPSLEVVLTGDHAVTMSALTESECVSSIMTKLTSLFGNIVLNPITVLFSKWNADPHSRGSHSFIPFGQDAQLRSLVADPVAGGRVCFAGEHTHLQHASTLHGAYESGLREAKRILELFTSIAPGQLVYPYSKESECLPNNCLPWEIACETDSEDSENENEPNDMDIDVVTNSAPAAQLLPDNLPSCKVLIESFDMKKLFV